MKAQYPNSLKQDKYVTVLCGMYQQKYPEFSKEQIRCYAYEMVGVITRQLNELDSCKDAQLYRIELLKKITTIPDLSSQSATIRRLSVYLGVMKKDLIEEVVKDDLEPRKIPFPEEHKTKYLRFISDVTAKVIDDICNITKAKLVASKMPEDRSAGSKRFRSEEKPSSFVERVVRGSKSDKEERNSFSEKEQRKMARVRFADNKFLGIG